MKKFLLALSIFIAAGISFNKNANAGCEVSLPNTLQACFNAVQLHILDVVVLGGTATVTGTYTAAQLNDIGACYTAYQVGAASCPGAPVLIFNAIQGPPATNNHPTAVKGDAVNG